MKKSACGIIQRSCREGQILINRYLTVEEFIRLTATELLKDLGYTIYTVNTGQEALDFLKVQTVDVILLDMVMPVMNGRETFEHILEQRIPGKVILSSGFSKDEDVLLMKEKGLFGFLKKPYQRFELAQMVADAIKSGNPGED